MVGTRGKGKASVSKSNSNNLAVVCAEPEHLGSSIEESAKDPLDVKEENSQIGNEGVTSVGEKKCDDIPVVVNWHEEEQLANQVNGETRDAANETIVANQTEDVPLCGQAVEISEEVSVGGGTPSNMDVGENEEKISEVAPEKNKEQMQDGFENKGIEAGEERKSSEAAAERDVNIDAGSSAYEHRMMEEKLMDNMQDAEANKVNAEEPLGPPTDYGNIECSGEDVTIVNDVKSVPEKVNRPKRKVLKKKVIKKKMAVQGDAKSKSLNGNGAPGEADKSGSNEDVKNEEKPVPADTGKAGEERTGSEAAAGGNTNTDKGLSETEHLIMEEKLMENLQTQEANKVNAEELVGSPIDVGKIECTGEDASISNDAKSVPEKVGIPKRKVLRKKMVKNKLVVQDDVASMEENRSPSLMGKEACGEAEKADTNEDVKNEDKAVPADHEKIQLTGEENNIAGSVKVEPERASGPKRKVLKKKVIKKKVVLGDGVAPVDEAKPQCSIDNDVSGESNNADTDKDVKNDEKAEIKPAVRVNRKRVRKKVPNDLTNIANAGGEQKPDVTNDEAGNKENKETVGQDLKNGEAVKSGNRVSRLKKRKRKKMLKEDTQKAVADSTNNPGPSEKSKSSKRTDSMGMIFMCSSETKKDCYRYKVLGLPASKKDIVSKIYKGMRLFLFDLDLRIMYGIYKAAGPGGYNIEPRAFKSQFPSQVRFTELKDCLPLAEEKFKKVIKDNYYTKNKFNCQLTNEQVKNLCKLFTETSKRAESKPTATQIPAGPSSLHRDRKRKRAEDSRKAARIDSQKAARTSSRELERSRRRAQEEAELERSRRRAQEEAQLERSRGWAHEVRRAPPIVIEDRYHRRPVVYEREAYEYIPSALPTTVYQQHVPAQNPLRTSSYAYDYEGGASTSRVDIYRRDSTLEHQHRIDFRSSRDWERSAVAPLSNVDPYVPYGETHAYREPAYEARVRHEPEYESASVRPAEYYRPADYRAPLPPYRRY